MKKTKALVLILSLIAGQIFAQEKKVSKGDMIQKVDQSKPDKLTPEQEAQKQKDAEIQKIYAVYSTPGEMQKLLADQVGEWNEKVTMWMAPGAPPVVSTAKCTITMMMGGRYQKAVSTGTMMGMPFEGQSIMGFDNTLKWFQSSWIDNFGTGITLMEGKYSKEENKIEFTGQMVEPMAGGKINARQVMKFVSKTEMIMEMYTTVGGQEVKNMEIVFTRVVAKK